jgi:threonylcarbamoyladenosine tRNA methylthiotransferase MtaB
VKVYFDSIGCRLNQSEIESIAGRFRAAGHEILAEPHQADVAVVNTCAVTNAAVSDSRAAIRQIARAGVSRIVTTGCWATLDQEEARTLPGVVRVVPNNKKHRLVTDFLNLPEHIYDLEPLAREPLPGLHHRTRAFIKVQDGCDNRCTFCITTIARGNSLSRSESEIIQDINTALRGGVREIVLTGVHLGSWGYDLGSHLRNLIRLILRETDAFRVRLSSLEPWDLDDSFLALWEDKRLLPHLHLPLQSGCSSTLKRMARKTSPDAFRRLVYSARQIIPGIAITTDIIAGFPGETKLEFGESLDFVREMNFAGGHVFSYSLRPGTAAARMRGQVPTGIRKQRGERLRQVLDVSAQTYRSQYIGRNVQALWESVSKFGDSGWQLEGWSGNNLRIFAYSCSPRWNELDEVVVTGSEGKLLRGVICNSG